MRRERRTARSLPMVGRRRQLLCLAILLEAFTQDHHAADRPKSTTIGVIEGWGQQLIGLAGLERQAGTCLRRTTTTEIFFSLFNFSKTAFVDEKSCICCIPSRLSLNSSFVSLSINYCSSHFHLVASLYSILASTSFHTVPYGTSGRVE